jgi:hypothetical protein
MEGGADRVQLRGGVDNLGEGCTRGENLIISTKFQNFRGCIHTHSHQCGFAAGGRCCQGRVETPWLRKWAWVPVAEIGKEAEMDTGEQVEAAGSTSG